MVSRESPSDLRVISRGICKRLMTFIDALTEIAEIDLLLYVSPDVDRSAAAVAEFEHYFCQEWKTQVNLFLCPRFVRQPPLPKWRSQLPGIFSFFEQTDTAGCQQVQAFEGCLSRKPGAIFVHRLGSMSPVMLTKQPLPALFFDLDDIEHVAFRRGIHQPPTRPLTWLYYLQIPALWWGERRAIRLSRQTFVCSERDRDYLVKQQGLPRVFAVPNAVTIPAPQPLPSEPTLLFLGSYNYYPNINGANFLIEQVFPKIAQAMPEACLIVAGKDAHNLQGYGKNLPGVEVVGFVPDLEALYQRTRVVCCPIFSGGGTRIKIIEAAAYGKPIVASKIGAEGLAMQEGREFLLANTPQQFADACLELLRNEALCQQLGAAARAVAMQDYDRAKIVRSIQTLIYGDINLENLII
jgi:glycosyltransferase involved in cell wall biosynthesis